MSRKLLSVACACLVSFGALVAAPGQAVGARSAAGREARELSTRNRLDDRRYIASGSRGYVIGTEDGRFPAMGFHTRGEMGGIWSAPLKLLDGMWFGINDEWVGPATRFTSGYGYSRLRLPSSGAVRITRTDFVPDGRRAALIGLELSNSGDARSFTLKMDAHSELLGAYPWGATTPNQLDFNLQDTVAASNGRLVFRERGRPHPNAEPHNWAAVVGANRTPIGESTGPDFRGPQDPAVICPAEGDAPPRCDDTEFGKGAGGQLRFRMTMPAGSSRTVWFGVAGSERGPAAAERTLDNVLEDPARLLATKVAGRDRLARKTKISIPGDRLLARGIEWSKQNLADSVQVATDLEVRETDTGLQYPPSEGTIDRVRFLGAGFPDYPWLFGTDGEFTAFASVGVGQFGPIKDHLRALKDASLIDNGNSGKVVHEVVTEGAVYFGSNDDPGNTDETA
ncbi:MAG: glycogen debranching protein, partial [Actinobacteria bacterium]|nr:glycogen debranching protein [Actinomycetota bacterium]